MAGSTLPLTATYVRAHNHFVHPSVPRLEAAAPCLTRSAQVPVYEFNVEGNHVMRRRADDWINATHILKVADFDKPARTRILEREVQKGVHEKVQGGYGKYQGQTSTHTRTHAHTRCPWPRRGR